MDVERQRQVQLRDRGSGLLRRKPGVFKLEVNSLQVGEQPDETSPVLAPDQGQVRLFGRWTAGEADTDLQDIRRVVPVVVDHRVLAGADLRLADLFRPWTARGHRSQS